MAIISDNMRHIAVLGSTGSIGTQTLDVVRQHPDRFKVELITANDNAELLAAQAVEFGVRDAVICNEARYEQLKTLLEGTPVAVHAGMQAVCDLVGGDNIQTVVTAMVGFSGVRSTVAALKAGKTIALANKETMVAAGSVVTRLQKEHGSAILPVDSEHSAIFQCLQGNERNHVAKIHLTASGGPFRTWERERIAAAVASDALKHPNWSMGAKVTIDSATMMNKGLEFIEARWLFDVEPERINVVVHPQSIIHSMVEYDDGAVIAQMGCPDMREPIQYALSWPERLTLNNKKIDFATLGRLDFEAPDLDRFPCLGIAMRAISKGGTAPTAMNAANEIAVGAYLRGALCFYDIPVLVEKTIQTTPFVCDPTLDDIYGTDAAAREIASSLLK